MGGREVGGGGDGVGCFARDVDRPAGAVGPVGDVCRCLQARIEHAGKQQQQRVWHEFEAWRPRHTYLDEKTVVVRTLLTRQSKHATSSWAGGGMANAAADPPVHIAAAGPTAGIKESACWVRLRPAIGGISAALPHSFGLRYRRRRW